MKKFIIIVFLIIGIPSIIFITDNNRRSKYENPFEIGRLFSYYYMAQNSDDMKLYSDKKIYEKIDNLHYDVPCFDGLFPGPDDIELVCSRKMWNTIVCTYAYYEYDKNLSFLYSVVLKPTGALRYGKTLKISFISKCLLEKELLAQLFLKNDG